MLVVYDFIVNGMLEKIIYNEPWRGMLLDRCLRVESAVRLAYVVVDLHEEY